MSDQGDNNRAWARGLMLSSGILTGMITASLNISGYTPQHRPRGAGEGNPTSGPNRNSGAQASQSRLDSEAVARLAAARTKQNNATLVIVAVPGAEVMLRPIERSKPAAASPFSLNDQNNTLTIPRLAPGLYELIARHPDHKSRPLTLRLAKGEIKPVTNLLLPIYGDIIIGGAPPGAGFSLDGRPIAAGSMLVSGGDGKVIIPRVLEGEHELEIRSAGYDPWKTIISVTPGITNPVASRLAPARITLTVRSRPGARVYLDNTDRGEILPDGSLVIRDLMPGSYRLSVAGEDYERAERTVELDLKERNATRDVELIPVSISDEGKEDFLSGGSKWVIEEDWKLEREGRLKGLVIRGERPGLFRTPSEKRRFNIYRDFRMSFDVRFLNGRGAAWIVRARDLKNYYLFQLTPAANGNPTLLSFFVCRDGQCEFKDNRQFPFKLDNPEASYHIQLEARGQEFIHTIIDAANPQPDDPQPMGTFTDATFKLGGIGFSGFQGAELLLQSLYVIPRG